MSPWKWLGESYEQLLLVLSLLPIIWSVYKYLDAKRAELKATAFKNYHGLIKDLVEPEPEGGTKFLDRQIAVVFELTKF